MLSRNKIKDFLSTILLLGLLAVGSAWLAKQNEIILQGQYKIVDGDSLVIDGRKIRLLGIDAPEYRQKCTLKDGEVYRCGKQSRLHLSKLAKSGRLNCTGWEEDKYQRLLAVCNVGDLVLNSQMVMAGWAISYGDYKKEEAKAKYLKVGVWQGGFENPSSWRENERDVHSVGWLSKFSLW